MKVTKSMRRMRIFSALEVSNICGVVNQTVINWIRNGHLKAFTTPGGQYRVYAKDLFAFLDKRGMGASVEALQVIMESSNWTTVLVISGEKELNGSLKIALEDGLSNFKVLQSFDSFDAGRKLTSQRPGFVILDAELPGIDCPQMVSAIKGDPVFGKPFVLLLQRGKGQGKPESADGFFGRPPDTKALLARIRELGSRREAAGRAETAITA